MLLLISLCSYNDENGTLSDNDVSVSVGVVAVATVKASA